MVCAVNPAVFRVCTVNGKTPKLVNHEATAALEAITGWTVARFTQVLPHVGGAVYTLGSREKPAAPDPLNGKR